MQQKDLSQLTSEELIKLATNQLVEKEILPIGLSEVRRFIISENLSEGKELIPAIIIYDRYIKWSTINNTITLSETLFFKEFKLHFPKIRKTAGYFYVISPAGFDLSAEHIYQLKQKWNSDGKFKKTKKKKVKKA